MHQPEGIDKAPVHRRFERIASVDAKVGSLTRPFQLEDVVIMATFIRLQARKVI